MHAQRLGAKQADARQDCFTAEYVAYALKLVALRLGARTLSISDYRTERAAMLRRDRARWLHGRHLILPDENQVVRVMGVSSWDEALASAGLAAPRSERGGGSSKIRAPTIPNLLERFYSHYRVQATSDDLRTFARANGIPYRDFRDMSFRQALAEWKEWRTGRGHPVPSAAPPRSERADYTHDVGAARPGEKRRVLEHPLEVCVEWVCRYLEELPASTHSTQTSYRDWARQHGAPAPAVLYRKHKGFPRVRRLAQERMRAERLSRPTSPAP